jgi:hypothetical protein
VKDEVSPYFEEEERAKASAHTSLRPRLIYEIIREEGETELRRPVSALAWSGLASRLSMRFSFLTQRARTQGRRNGTSEGLMRRCGRQARPADAAAVEMLDQTGRAYPGRELASIRVGRPVAAARAKCGIAHERLGQQVDQGLAIDGIHAPMIWRERMRNNGRRSPTFSRVVGCPLSGLFLD